MSSTQKINTELLDKAIIFATQAHKGVPRKGSITPYILHPMEAAAIVATMTTDIEIIAAAVLHDTVEDNKSIGLEDIEREFGFRVKCLVAAESEEKEDDEVGSWTRRKQATLDFLRDKATEEEKIITLGDKLSNIRAIYNDYLKDGDKLWERFNQKDKEMQGKYYKGIEKELESLSGYPAYKEYCDLSTFIFAG